MSARRGRKPTDPARSIRQALAFDQVCTPTRGVWPNLARPPAPARLRFFVLPRKRRSA